MNVFANSTDAKFGKLEYRNIYFKYSLFLRAELLVYKF